MYGVAGVIFLAFVTTTALNSIGAAFGELLFLVIAVLCYWYVVGCHEDYLKSKTLLYLSNFSKEVKAAEALGNADVGGEEVWLWLLFVIHRFSFILLIKNKKLHKLQKFKILQILNNL